MIVATCTYHTTINDLWDAITNAGGFARARIEGSRRIYSVDSKPLQEVDAWLDQFRGLWEQRLKALTAEIARGKRERRR